MQQNPASSSSSSSSVTDNPTDGMIQCLNKPVAREENNLNDLSPNELIALKSYQYAIDQLRRVPIAEAEKLSFEELFSGGIIGSKESMREFLERQEHPFLNTIPIFEPSEVVGQNPNGNPVRASCNIASIINQVEPYWKCALFECWRNGIRELKEGSQGRFFEYLRDAKLYFMEGGPQYMYDEQSFTELYPQLPKKDFIEFVMNLLLNRGNRGSPAGIFICLGHQAVAEALIWILRKAVDDVRRVSTDEKLLETVDFIDMVGNHIIIHQNGMCATGYRDDNFATSLGPQPEIGIRRLNPYRTSTKLPTCRRHEQKSEVAKGIAKMLAKAHDSIAEENSGIINDLLQSVDFCVAMFHTIEWNEEACLFTNWAFQELSNHMDSFTGELSWMKNMPTGVAILCSTYFEDDPKPWTSVAATAIFYEDSETGEVRKNFTLQFHPELQEGLEDVITGEGEKEIDMYDDGVKCLFTLAYHAAEIAKSRKQNMVTSE